LTLSASIVIPTRARPRYLEVALASIVPQAAVAGAEVLVIDDAGPSPEIRALAERFGARYEPHPGPLGLNVARNTGVERSHGDLVVFVDDDVEVASGWLAALLAAARAHPQTQVFAGPIRPRLEGRPPRSCGREGSPITSLDLGPEDTDRVGYAWGANMAVRRSALERVGPFDVSLENGGDEQEWQDRLANVWGSAPILYVAAAALDHRRTPSDARLRKLMRASRGRGRASRRFDAWRGEAPPLARELLTLLGCLGHVVRRRCPAGLTMVAHSAGRLAQGLRERVGTATQGPTPSGTTPSNLTTSNLTPSEPGSSTTQAPLSSSAKGPTVASDDFLSGASGTVGGVDAVRRALRDERAELWNRVSGQRRRLDRAARDSPPPRRVLVLGVERPDRQVLARAIRAELNRSRHAVEVHFRPPGDLGKFENLNRLLVEHPPEDHDWLLMVDDDVVLPRGFLDQLVFLAERFSLDLAQPSHRAHSHAAWEVTRHRRGSVVRETRFVEIGPVTAFASSTFSTLLPFPSLRMGWGLDLHWAALAREHGWRCGVLDAVAIRHSAAPAADAYSREAAIAEARAFLADRPYVRADEAQQTLQTHERW
jgi:GT2 family glycosyltransferase